jgi:hypothetical protein
MMRQFARMIEGTLEELFPLWALRRKRAREALRQLARMTAGRDWEAAERRESWLYPRRTDEASEEQQTGGWRRIPLPERED